MICKLSEDREFDQVIFNTEICFLYQCRLHPFKACSMLTEGFHEVVRDLSAWWVKILGIAVILSQHLLSDDYS